MSKNIEKGEKVFGSTDLALKSTQIVDFYHRSSGFGDFENKVDHGTDVNFGSSSGWCLS